MPERVRRNWVVIALLLFATLVFTFGIAWGLPSRKTDAILFGDRRPWSGAEILALAPQRTGGPADVDVNPAARGSVLNDTDAKRAEIVRRYRLFTYQPDEMITMMSLAGMHPSQRDFDPRLYQYGGLWIYPVGGLIRVLLQPKNDQAYYLDHPDEFGKFYMVARAYSAAWGVVGAWAVYGLMRSLSRFAAVLATLLYITMPVVVNVAHEAKPHLAGTALMLLAALAAKSYIEQGGWRRFAWMSILCGAAAGMILSSIVAVIIAIVAVALRHLRELRHRPLAPVRGGEGWGQGVEPLSKTSDLICESTHPPPPNPLPHVRGRGNQTALARVRSFVARAVAGIALGTSVDHGFDVAGPPHPNPLPRVRGRGNRTRVAWVRSFARRAVERIPLWNSVDRNFDVTGPPHPNLLPRVRGRGDQTALGGIMTFSIRAVASIAIAAAVYALTNPYVIKHLLTDRAVLAQNLSNSRAMYHVDFLAGIWRAIELLAAGCGWLTLLGGILGGAALAVLSRSAVVRYPSFANRWVLLGPLSCCALVVIFQFAALAAGKPGEYGRFGLVVDVTLAMLAAGGLGVAPIRSRWRIAASLVLLLGTIIPSAIYEYGFWCDSRNTTRRDQLASQLAQLSGNGYSTIALWDEPAPYLMPPIDLWKWKISLLPNELPLSEASAQVVIRPTDRPIMDPILFGGFEQQARLLNSDWLPAEISWANKCIQIWTRPMAPR